jgi:protein-tyrosine kinase
MKKSKAIADRSRTLITYHSPKSIVSEAFRTLRTNIQFASVDQEIKTILLTSTGQGEGKSTTAANLAVVMAQAGHRVLLIDADMRKPTSHLFFRVPNRNGLSNLLARQDNLQDVVKTTLVENLHLITSGPIPPNPSELLGSSRMSEIITSLKKEYDYILFDTPPIVAVTDAQVLANKVDGVLLVIYSGKTNREMAVKAMNLLDHVHARILGTVLNHRKIEADSQYYYYYYGHK